MKLKNKTYYIIEYKFPLNSWACLLNIYGDNIVKCKIIKKAKQAIIKDRSKLDKSFSHKVKYRVIKKCEKENIVYET